MTPALSAPFPWFGGKSRVAPLVWARFGADVPNYVEPFAGSLAVLLARPGGAGRVETVNDLDAYLVNFWRATAADPDAVAEHADHPVNEVDLHARHRWLVTEGRAVLDALEQDPLAYDARVAGWWVWGLSAWIGGAWCGEGTPSRQLPHLGNRGRGVHAGARRDLRATCRALRDRLRRVRVCRGDWTRVLGPSVTVGHGATGVLLDPPYAAEAGRDLALYARDSGTVAHDVRAWAVEHGDDPLLRVALCGYEGEHAMPASWSCVAWSAQGGYGGQGSGRGRANKDRERIWFSPHCLSGQRTLF